MYKRQILALTWQWMYDPFYGLINHYLRLLGLISGPQVWILQPNSSLWPLIVVGIWLGFPFMSLMLLSGMQGIPQELYEAAKVDGANAVQRFFRITLPLLKPALLVALLFRTLDAFRVFDSIFIMTRGSQNTESVSILGYNQLISRLNLGLGSAVSVLIFLLVLLIAFLFVRGFGTTVPQGGGKK